MARDPFGKAKPYRDVELGHPSSDPLSRPSARPSSFDDDSDARDAGPEGWEREQQHALLDRQDRTLASLEGTLGTIGGQARLMGQEVNEQNEMLDHLDTAVDSTERKLSRATAQIKHFLERAEEKGSGWCIAILIVILCLLLLAVILV